MVCSRTITAGIRLIPFLQADTAAAASVLGRSTRTSVLTDITEAVCRRGSERRSLSSSSTGEIQETSHHPL